MTRRMTVRLPGGSVMMPGWSWWLRAWPWEWLTPWGVLGWTCPPGAAGAGPVGAAGL